MRGLCQTASAFADVFCVEKSQLLCASHGSLHGTEVCRASVAVEYTLTPAQSPLHRRERDCKEISPSRADTSCDRRNTTFSARSTSPPCAGRLPNSKRRGHSPSSTSIEFMAAKCHAPLDVALLLKKAKVVAQCRSSNSFQASCCAAASPRQTGAAVHGLYSEPACDMLNQRFADQGTQKPQRRPGDLFRGLTRKTTPKDGRHERHPALPVRADSRSSQKPHVRCGDVLARPRHSASKKSRLCPISAAISTGDSTSLHAAASSIPSGKPPDQRQIWSSLPSLRHLRSSRAAPVAHSVRTVELLPTRG